MAQDDKDYQSTYIEMRTLLDAIQMGSLRYCLEVKGTKARLERMTTVINDLKELESNIRERRDQQRLTASPSSLRAVASVASVDSSFEPDAPDNNGCPDGYYRCGAACVPYPCPDTSQ